MKTSKKKPTPAKPPEGERTVRATFDLRDEPWIPIVREDGTAEELSLRVVLRDAPRLREIRDPLPTVEFGLYRLLVTLVLDIFEPRSADDLESLLGEREFDAAEVDRYFEKWHDRFDLFHQAHPFLQTPGMGGEKPKPLAGLLHPLPSGTSANHFHHGDERAFGVCAAVAARLLTTIAPFMMGVGSGNSPSINEAPPWYVLIRGRNLFDTLCLNCPVLSDLLPLANGEEPPAWRSSRPVKEELRLEASLLESFTWRPRRIQFVPDGSGRCSLTNMEASVIVREMKFEGGFFCKERGKKKGEKRLGLEWRDANVPYKISDKKVDALRPEEGRPVWRHTAPIALLRETDYASEKGKFRFERPAIVSQFAYLDQRGMVEASLPLDLVLYGLRTDQAKIDEWHRERLSLPAPLLWKTQFQRVAQQEMDRADSVAYALRQAIKRVYPREGAGNKAAFNTLIARAQNDFWTTLRPHYDFLLHALAPLRDDDTAGEAECLKNWRLAVRKAAESALRAAIDDLDADADSLERQTAARRSFANALFVLLDPEAAAKVRDRRKKKPKKEDKP